MIVDFETQTQQLLAVMDIFEEIKATSSKKAKEQIILRHKDTELFKSFLVFMYDDFINTGVGKKKLEKSLFKTDHVFGRYMFTSIIDLFEFMKDGAGTDNAIMAIQEYIALQDMQLQSFLIEVLSRTYKCGITAKTINKAWGEMLIREFGCMLAHPLAKYPDRIKNFYITQKLDGHRCICIADAKEGTVKFYTRKGLEIDGLSEVAEDVSSLLNQTWLDHPIVLDGELLVAESRGDANIDFRTTSKVLKKDGSKYGITFNVFDMLPYEEFLAGQSEEPYSRRRKILDTTLGKSQFKYLHLVPVLYCGSDYEAIGRLQHNFVEPNKWEGLMMNDANGLYVTKRSPTLLKIKKFFNADIPVIDIYEGEGENRGRMGGVIAQFKDFRVQIGSGFSEDDRIRFWEHPSEIISSIIDVQYFEETENQNGGKGLRFPTFKSVRTDKTIDDISYES